MTVLPNNSNLAPIPPSSGNENGYSEHKSVGGNVPDGTYVHKSVLLDPRMVEFGADRVASGVQKFELKHELSEIFGGLRINPPDYEAFLRAAEEAIVVGAEVPTTQVIARLRRFYASIMSDMSASHKDKIAASSELRKLLGLDRATSNSEEEAKILRQLIKVDEVD